MKKTATHVNNSKPIAQKFDQKDWGGVGVVCSPALFHAIFIFLLAVTAVIAYSNNFTAEFVYDDYPFILENPAVRSLSHPSRFFLDRESFSEKGSYVIYRPLAALSFAANYALSGYRPAAYHAVNIALHIACGVLLYLFLHMTFGHAEFAFLAALLFLVHPVQTEAVSWISSRGNAMFLSFFLLAMMCYRKWSLAAPRRRMFFVLALVFALLSLLSKEMAVVLPVLLIVYDASVNRPETQKGWKTRLLTIIPFAGLSGVYVIVRHLVLGETRQMDYWGGSPQTALLTMTKAFAYYVRLMFIPRPLMVEYMVPLARSLFQPTVVFSLAVLTLLAIICVFSYRRAPVVFFGIAWFFASLLPVSNIIPLQAIINERFLYLPSIGFCAILASPALCAQPALGKRMSRGIIIALLIIAALYGALTLHRNRDWRNSLSLWTASVKASPAAPTSRYNLGLELFFRQRYDEAIEHLKMACRLQEKFPSAHGVLGNIYIAQEKYDDAIREFEIGLKQAPDDVRFRYGLALAWFKKGEIYAGRAETDAAAECFQKAMSYKPGFAPAEDELKELRSRTEHSASAEPKTRETSR